MRSFSTWIKAIKIIARQLLGFLDLTEEDQIRAGIYLDHDR